MPRELPHNTPEQVRGYLREALDIVAELEPPEDLRAPLFTKAADLIASKQVFIDAAEAQPIAAADLGLLGRPRRH